MKIPVAEPVDGYYCLVDTSTGELSRMGRAPGGAVPKQPKPKRRKVTIGSIFKAKFSKQLGGCGCQYGDAIWMMDRGADYVRDNLERINGELMTAFRHSKKESVRKLTQRDVAEMIYAALQEFAARAAQ